MVKGFDEDVFEVFERFDMPKIIRDLDERDRLPEIVQGFAALDVHPDRMSNAEMGDVFEELIRRFMEASKDVAGDYFTPREVVRLMVSLLFTPDEQDLSDPHQIRQIYDPTCGTGDMLSEAHEWLQSHDSGATLNLFGQEFNSASYAMAKADLIIKRQDAQNIYFGDTLLKDGHEGHTFTYCLSNPPFGQEWKVQAVKAERERDGDEGRFAADLPSMSEGAMLFLHHLVSKMRPATEGGGREAIVLNGSALFTGAVGSGPSEIRRWLLENDLVDVIVGLPTDMFYNTSIATYIWVLDNNKLEERRGRTQLIDATAQWVKMRKSIGTKRHMLSSDNIAAIVNLYGEFTDAESEFSKVFTTEDFGYRTITDPGVVAAFLSTAIDMAQSNTDFTTALLKDQNRHSLADLLKMLGYRKYLTTADYAFPPQGVEVEIEHAALSGTTLKRSNQT